MGSLFLEIIIINILLQDDAMIRGGLGRLDYGPYVYFMQLCRKYLQMIYRIIICWISLPLLIRMSEDMGALREALQ